MYTYQVKLTKCMETFESLIRSKEWYKQVIAIEEKGYLVEYNRGPTTAFATSTDGNRINIKVNSFFVLYNSYTIEYTGKLELCCCGGCGGNLLPDSICRLRLQQQQTLLEEKPTSGGRNIFAVFVDV